MLLRLVLAVEYVSSKNTSVDRIRQEPNGLNKLLSYLLDSLSFSSLPPPARPWILLRQPNTQRPSCESFVRLSLLQPF